MRATQIAQTILGPLHCYVDPVGSALVSGAWRDQQIQSALDEADPEGWALDLGAHVGWFTIYLAQRHRRVLAVEAHPVTYRMLLENVTACGVADRVVCLQVAAFDRPGSMTLVDPAWIGWPIPDPLTLEDCPHPASIAFVPTTQPAPLVVSGIPLDVYFPEGARVSLIKVDVQGCDLRALEGLRRTITRDRPLIVFEFEESASAWQGDTWEDYLRFFGGLNYSVTRVREDLWDFVGRPL